MRGVTERAGLVLFVGSRAGQAQCVVKAAEMAKGCHLFTKWIPGTITNGQQILGRCAKKVFDEFDKEVPGFEAQLLENAVLKPDLVVCLNPLENYVLLHECGLNNIPTIGIIDTDVNPTWVTYPIPANDDSLRCVHVVAGVLGRAGQEGQEIRMANAHGGIIEYRQDHGLQPPSKEDEAARKLTEGGKLTEPAGQAEAGSEDDLLYEEDVNVGMAVDQMPDMRDFDQSLVGKQPPDSTQESLEDYKRTTPLQQPDSNNLLQPSG